MLEAIRALRLATAWSRSGHVSRVRLAGADAFSALDAICPSELHLRDGRIMATLLLNDDATIAADLFVCRDDDEFILLAEGMSGPQLLGWIRGAAPASTRIALEDLGADHGLISVHGPYAWELLGEVLGPDVIGLPYLSFLRTDGITCFRTGKTGEYGYDLLVRNEELAAMAERLRAPGATFDLVEIGLDTLDQAALENWFFNIRREGAVGATPLELQLQWRVSYRKSFPGSAALLERRRAGPTARLTMLTTGEPIEVGAAVRAGDRRIGMIVNAGDSGTREEVVALALLERAYAASGIDLYTVESSAGRVPARTVSPPLINNRSLYVSPQLHSYAAREQEAFPPLVRTHGIR